MKMCSVECVVLVVYLAVRGLCICLFVDKVIVCVCFLSSVGGACSIQGSTGKMNLILPIQMKMNRII